MSATPAQMILLNLNVQDYGAYMIVPVPSRTAAGVFYNVTVDRESVTCPCRGFRSHWKCWHTALVRELIEA